MIDSSKIRLPRVQVVPIIHYIILYSYFCFHWISSAVLGNHSWIEEASPFRHKNGRAGFIEKQKVRIFINFYKKNKM